MPLDPAESRIGIENRFEDLELDPDSVFADFGSPITLQQVGFMTFSPKVWGDALRRLRDEIPDFAFDAWIAPLSVKLVDDRILLGCQTSFHRDRVRAQYGDSIRRCWRAARSENDASAPSALTIDFLTLKEFDDVAGQPIEIAWPERVIARVAPAVAQTAMQATGSSTIAATVPVMPEAPRYEGHSSRGAHSRGSHARAIQTRVGVAHSEPRTSKSESSKPFMSCDASSDAPAGLRAVPDSKRPKQIRNVRDNSRGSTRSKSGGPAAIDSQSGRESRAGRAEAPLQPELPFSFESFVVGPCNALAREAALALARRRQRSLNQLYLGGDTGMGKTHLARATAIEARLYGRDVAQDGRREPAGSRVLYTSAEKFTSEFVSAMRLGQSEEWKRRYRGPIGMLIVEDVQFFSGRAKTQLELFHTVQHVLDAGGSVLLTGDRAPRDLVGLDERMRAQVGRGFVAELEMPDALVRRHILRAKASAGGIHLPADCLDLLVESTEGSVRDIESVLIQVVTTSSLLGRTIDLDLTREAIDLKSGASTCLAPQTLPVAEVVRLVAAFFGKRPEALASRSRRRDVLVPRQLAMYLAHRYTDASMTEIGRALGRDHPSVRNAIERIERLVLENAPLRYQIEALSERIDERLNQRSTMRDASPE